MKILLQTLFFFLLISFVVNAQLRQQNINPKFNLRSTNAMKDNVTGLNENVLTKIKSDSTPCFYKRKGEWQKIIDDYWGPGDPYTKKLSVFDTYVSYVRANFPAFVYSKLNWDSVAAYWRMKITDSTSRGAFHAILGKLGYSLNEWHSGAFDNTVESMSMVPGTPGVALTSHDVRHFGAALTPLQDKSLLVYKVISNHPLGLELGDRVLGYEGIPWPQLFNELIEAGVCTDFLVGGCPTAKEYYTLAYAGLCWHLFDTIDVVKYKTGETVHLPTAPLTSLDISSPILNCDQLPIPGVPMPSEDLLTDDVTYGIVQGTNIGYIYVRHHVDAKISSQFEAAVKALVNTEGLIIDLRLNYGGSYGLEQGIARLMNFEDSTLVFLRRSSATDLQKVAPVNGPNVSIPMDIGTLYDHPIAVLVGPQCRSYGDISAWELSYVPNTHFLGKSTTGAYSGWWWWGEGPYVAGYSLYNTACIEVDHRFPNSQILNTEFPIDEEVWLTPDGVAKGEDDVVKRALEWMNNLVYPHNIITDKSYYTLSQDTVHLSTIIENPNSHQISARAYVKTSVGVLVDSVNFWRHRYTNEWKAELVLPQTEEFYKASVTVFDESATTSLTLPNATRFTTAGPLKVDSVAYLITVYSYYINIKPFVKNSGNSFTITNARIRLYCNDPWVTSINLSYHILPDIEPGQTVGSESWILVKIDTTIFPGYFNLRAEMVFDGWAYWTDSTKAVVTGIDDEQILPLSFRLEQNYPNPFNPSTKISWQLPVGSNATLKVYDILGREVAILVNEYKPAGKCEAEFYSASLPSGVYFYQLKAGEYKAVKKMILLK